MFDDEGGCFLLTQNLVGGAMLGQSPIDMSVVLDFGPYLRDMENVQVKK